MRLIDADALKKHMGCEDAVKYGNETPEQQHISYSTLMMYEIADYIEDMPTIEAEPVRHSYWTRDGECHNCGEMGLYNGNEELVPSRWCPCCGAKMDGGAK